MNRIAIILVAFVLAIVPVSTFGQVEPSVQSAQAFPHTDRLPGVDLAEGVSLVTGTAVSPLLGVTVFGAWSYFRTPEAERDRLPWFTAPYVWGLGCVLLALCLLKDVAGTVVPTLIKKPLDAADALEDKLSAAVACGGFVPFVAVEMSRHFPDDASSVESNVQMASMLPFGGLDMSFLVVPAAMLGFAVVWLACHAINVLILLSPFGVVDGLLKTFKLLLLSLIGVSAAIAPWLGAVVSLLVIYVAWMLAPWAFRLTVFGTLFSLDVFLPWRGRRRARPEAPRAFLAKAIDGVPVRTYGHLERTDDGVGFRYRPWLVLPARSVVLPTGTLAIARGVLYPSLIHAAGDRSQGAVVLFRPGYRSHVQTIASTFGNLEVRESSIARGFRAVRLWAAETLKFDRWRGKEA